MAVSSNIKVVSKAMDLSTIRSQTPTKRKIPPIVFIHRDANNRHRTKDEAKVIASHASGCYRRWEKVARRKIVLDTSTKSILGYNPSPFTPPVISTATGSTPEGADEEFDRSDMLDVAYALYTRGESDKWWITYSDMTSMVRKSPPPPTVLFGKLTPCFDPFTSSGPMADPEIRATLHFYFKIIRPFVTYLIPGWQWLDNLTEIQATPVLTYAVAAISSTFLSGCLKGGPGVVLPPLPESTDVSKVNEGLLWPVPPWLRLQAMCIRELNVLLKKGDIGDGVYQAILFLFRLAVLLADGTSARMHFDALNRIQMLRSDIPHVEMGKELAVLRVNVVAAFLHSASIVVVRTKDSTLQDQRHLVEVERDTWGEQEYWRHQAGLNGRIFAWKAGANEAGRGPSDWVQKDSEMAIRRIDSESMFLLNSEWIDVARSYQVALYLMHYLNAVSYSTFGGVVETQTEVLKSLLHSLDLTRLLMYAPNTFFFALLAGAMGSRGRIGRFWFIEAIGGFYEGIVEWMDDVFEVLGRCIDPHGVCWPVIEELWRQVLEWRLARQHRIKANGTRLEIYRQRIIRPVEENRPLSYEPDMRKELRVMERHGETVEGIA